MVNEFDLSISKWFMDGISKNEIVLWLTARLSEINELGQMWIVIILGLLIFECIRSKKFRFYFLFGFLIILVGWLLAEKVAKPLIGRERPWHELSGFVSLMESVGYKVPTTPSFPSGHSLFGFACAGLIGLKYKKVIIPCYVVAFLIALSRIILGCHYFTDVIAGTVLGIGLGIGAYYGSKKLSLLLEERVYKKK